MLGPESVKNVVSTTLLNYSQHDSVSVSHMELMVLELLELTLSCMVPLPGRCNPSPQAPGLPQLQKFIALCGLKRQRAKKSMQVARLWDL